jgi:hypothetical protein
LKRLKISFRIDSGSASKEFGFNIIYPEVLQFDRQLEYYANCRVMAGFAGSALHNCLFCDEETIVIEVGDKRSRDKSVVMQRVTNQIAKVDQRFVAYQGTSEGSIDVDNLRDTLRNLPVLVTNDTGLPKDSEFGSRDFMDHYVWPATMLLHLANMGDVRRVGRLEQTGLKDGHGRIEGLSIILDKDAPFGIDYKVLQHNNVWTDWSGSGTFLGTRSQSLPIKGYAVRLTGANTVGFRCVCLGRFAGQSTIVEARDGADCKANDNAPLMAMRIQLEQ